MWSPTGDWQPLRRGSHRPRFVNEDQLGGVQSSGEVTGQVGQTDTDKHDLVVAQLSLLLDTPSTHLLCSS